MGLPRRHARGPGGRRRAGGPHGGLGLRATHRTCATAARSVRAWCSAGSTAPIPTAWSTCSPCATCRRTGCRCCGPSTRPATRWCWRTPTTGRLQLLALFDLLVNNADRKGSHVLPVPDGPVYGVDHGLTMHVETKLRTVLWGWAGSPDPGRRHRGAASAAPRHGRAVGRGTRRPAHHPRAVGAARPNRPAARPAGVQPPAAAPHAHPVAAAVADLGSRRIRDRPGTQYRPAPDEHRGEAQMGVLDGLAGAVRYAGRTAGAAGGRHRQRRRQGRPGGVRRGHRHHWRTRERSG